MKILFCDIDGTLTETISGHTFKQHPQDVKVMEGADKAIAHFANFGWRIVGISNQGGIAAGHKSLDDAIAEMRFTHSSFPQLLTIFFCPDFEGNECYKVSDKTIPIQLFRSAGIASFRKPGHGMLEIAANLYCFDLSKDECWLIGDRPEDEQCAINAGINFCPADVWRDWFRDDVSIYQGTGEQLRFLEDVELAHDDTATDDLPSSEGVGEERGSREKGKKL